MATERVLVTIRGEGMKKGKKWGVGGGKNIVVIERFLVATQMWWPKTFQLPCYYGDQKPFIHHAIMAIESLSITMWVATKNISISMPPWWLKTFW